MRNPVGRRIVTKMMQEKMMANQHFSDEQAQKQALKTVHGMYIKQQIEMFDALKAALGEQVEDVIRQTASRNACQLIQFLGQQAGSRTIDDLVDVLWEPLRGKGYEFTRQKTADGVHMRCTVCPFASMYRAMNGAGWGFALYCAVDEALTTTFNPQIGFRREHTLMEGHDCCDHFYFIID
jgi:predicted ArsR family transcriptional regulator